MSTLPEQTRHPSYFELDLMHVQAQACSSQITSHVAMCAQCSQYLKNQQTESQDPIPVSMYQAIANKTRKTKQIHQKQEPWWRQGKRI